MSDMPTGIYYLEQQSPDLRFGYRVDRVIYSGKTRFQKVDIVETRAFGKTLFLDEKIQSAAVDEFIFHEALVHPAMVVHPHPRKVWIAGGGEGATLREVLRHNTVERAVMVDIDGELVELCKRHMPEWGAGAWEDARTEVVIGDARGYLFETDERYDVLIFDLTEPLEEGPSQLLFTEEYYRQAHEVLTEDGVLVVQSASADPVYLDFAASIRTTLRRIFPKVETYWAFVFSFQIPWAFTLASRSPDILLDPREVARRLEARGVTGLRYYHSRMHEAMFVLPGYLEEGLAKRGRVIRDAEPFVWPD